ncbi:CHAT domain-containing protein [Nostoc sp. FACHB-133]|uniref:CHAT domain-containing protein n=1 Tax=Nostoc sp. FACHB-133 TaxID=2692835 RepID=UPI001682C226|nr:CHAT domain-containing protein [Nostoc sp. FACHB-133]MBD2526469.1 CHAT domain-containing protein [Nostoc sp. FACHB-133]
MEPLLKRHFRKLYRRISVQKVNHQIIYLFIVALISLISVFGIHKLLVEKAIGSEPAAQLICTKTPNLSPEQLSSQGRESYESGQFDEAMDCWQKAIAGYRKLDNETETVNNQINLAQAEQALGFFPRACSTLLQIYGEESCKTLPQEEEKHNEFGKKLAERANSPSKIAGLRSFGNVLRGLGELNWSHEVLLLSLDKSQPQEKAAIWLDLGNTRRALSNKEQDLYYRSQDEQNLICAIIDGYATTEAYQMAEGEIGSTSPSLFNTKLQSQLNQLSLVLDLQDWRNNGLNQQTKGKQDVLNQLFSPSGLFVRNNKAENCWTQLGLNPSQYKLTNQINLWLVNQLSEQNPLIQLPKIDNLQQQIEELPETHAALFTRLNFAKNLIRIKNVPTTKIKQFLETSIEQAKRLRDSKTESYGYGYLGELYEKRGEFELAKKNTETALFIAQSLELASETEYLWEWQLGRIYKSQVPARTQAQTKAMLQGNLNAAREIYQRAYVTLQSLRRELVAANPDAQFSFLNDIDSIYRDYVNLLLWDDSPSPEYLFKAREVIASLQAVELENFLRVACPEYNVEEIDTIVDKKAPNTAFLYPIRLEDRIEVIVKLPNNVNSKSSGKEKLEHYRESITVNFEDEIRQFQRDLEEEYTFEAVIKEGKKIYDLLLKGTEKFIKNNPNIDTLVFALDTNLRNIPLAALVVDDTKNPPTYLIDKYAVALAPRLQIPTPRIIQDKKLSVLAAGLTKPDAEKYRQFPEYFQKFGKLPFVTREIEEIQKIGGSKISLDKLVDDEFNTNQLERKVNSSIFQILHLATHGEFSSSPEKTFILSYDKPIVVNELGNIFRRQAQNQPEPIELIVLSACETAAGDQRATLGISGVGVRAGARSAIASLWTLDDKISVDFTKKLYEQLLKPELTKAQALRNAQRELRDEKKFPGRQHPRYWAPYILLGNWL